MDSSLKCKEIHKKISHECRLKEFSIFLSFLPGIEPRATMLVQTISEGILFGFGKILTQVIDLSLSIRAS